MLAFDLATGNGFIIWKFLFQTFFFGIGMSLFLVYFHRRGLKQNGVQEITAGNLSVNQAKNLKSELDITEIMKKLKNNPITGKMEITEMENGILLKTKASWKSWGEVIKIILKSEKEFDFEYQVSSSPKLKTTLVDYGKSIENICQIEYVIKNTAQTIDDKGK